MTLLRAIVEAGLEFKIRRSRSALEGYGDDLVVVEVCASGMAISAKTLQYWISAGMSALKSAGGTYLVFADESIVPTTTSLDEYSSCDKLFEDLGYAYTPHSWGYEMEDAELPGVIVAHIHRLGSLTGIRAEGGKLHLLLSEMPESQNV